MPLNGNDCFARNTAPSTAAALGPLSAQLRHGGRDLQRQVYVDSVRPQIEDAALVQIRTNALSASRLVSVSVRAG